MTSNAACALDCVKLHENYRSQQVQFCEERSIEVAVQFSNFDVNVRIHFDPTWSAVGLKPIGIHPL
jgi:hypothetical protein